jgi:predicted 3-demethylubiquinone-9 3-methyltransferase (glyoxalase superfamily)
MPAAPATKESMMTKRIVPYLWFEKDGLEAAEFYVSLFKDGEVIESRTFDNGGPDGESTFREVTFRLRNIEYVILEAGPEFKFNEAISFMIECEDQAEVDYFWNGLTSDGGQESVCGWLKDKYGLSWQVVPNRYFELMNDSDKAAADRVMKAMLQMVKIDVAALEAASRGE